MAGSASSVRSEKQYIDVDAEASHRIATIFAALSNPARIDILKHIAKHRHCGCKDITQVLPLAQSTVSQHLKVLIESGIIVSETVHPRSRYVVNEDLIRDLSETTSAFLKSCCGGNCRP
ncbi:MAG: metalloregulator ArsR/SmtB family transcription factor [Pseudomonadota bacterium]